MPKYPNNIIIKYTTGATQVIINTFLEKYRFSGFIKSMFIPANIVVKTPNIKKAIQLIIICSPPSYVLVKAFKKGRNKNKIANMEKRAVNDLNAIFIILFIL